MGAIAVIFAASFWAIICAIMAKDSKKVSMAAAICLGLFLRVVGLIILAFMLKGENKELKDELNNKQ